MLLYTIANPPTRRFAPRPNPFCDSLRSSQELQTSMVRNFMEMMVLY